MSATETPAPRLAVLDYTVDKDEVNQFLGSIPEDAIYRGDPDRPEVYCQRLLADPRPKQAVVFLTAGQSALLLRVLQVSRYHCLFEQNRRMRGSPIYDEVGIFVALLEFSTSGGGGLIVFDGHELRERHSGENAFQADPWLEDLAAGSVNDPIDTNLNVHADSVHLGFGPISESVGTGSPRLAFIDRIGIIDRKEVSSRQDLGAAILCLLESSKTFGFSEYRAPTNRTMPAEWVGFEFSIRREQENRLRQEFAEAGARSKFLELCKEIFRGDIQPMLHTLHALRLCRRIVNWTLEGAPFRCTILISTSDAYEANRELPGTEIAPLFAPKEPIYFNFNHLSDVRNLAEMIQSDGLILFVDAQDGEMRNISVYQPKHEDGEHYWQEKYARLTDSDDCFIIHLRGGHFVELYGKGEMGLWFDGYGWQLSPYRDLEEICKSHFGKMRDPKSKVRRLMQVIPALLDEQKSSIILLLNSKDNKKYEEILTDKELEPMRDTIKQLPSKVAIDRLSVSTLEGILKLDGSHVIDNQGMLRVIAHKITDRLAKSDPATPTKVADNEGTGTRAARNLSAALPNSFVIKVSASGNIKIFQTGEKYPRPATQKT